MGFRSSKCDRQQINGLKWPVNVIMRAVIGDFGCGRAKLAELLRENKMYNFVIFKQIG